MNHPPQVAEVTCNGRVVSVLEGGYNLGVLKRGVRCHLHTAAMGTDCPLAPNLTAQGRTHNRRVELQLRTK